MFDTLANRLQDALGDLGRKQRLDEETVTRATREIRLALLEADVDFQVVKEFVAAVRERALGQDVLKGLEPGQQVVKIVHEELTELMGSADSKLVFGRPPVVVLLCGLQGSGKTTAAAKLALHLRKREKKTPGLVAAGRWRSTSSSSSASSCRCRSIEPTCRMPWSPRARDSSGRRRTGATS